MMYLNTSLPETEENSVMDTKRFVESPVGTVLTKIVGRSFGFTSSIGQSGSGAEDYYFSFHNIYVTF